MSDPYQTVRRNLIQVVVQDGRHHGPTHAGFEGSCRVGQSALSYDALDSGNEDFPKRRSGLVGRHWVNCRVSQMGGLEWLE